MAQKKTKTTARSSSATATEAASAPARILDLWYAKDVTLGSFELNQEYSMISAKDNQLVPDESLLTSGVDVGLFRLHISNATERRKLLGLKKDERYEIMVSFSPIHLHGTEKREVLKVSYARFFNIDKGESGEGFTYKKMFLNLQLKDSLSFDVKLTEIDNDKVDPDPLSQILNDANIGKVLDLSPYNPKQYVELASNFVNSIQNIFGADKEGDDEMWNDTLSIEPKPTIPGSYKLRAGIYAIIEQQSKKSVKITNTVFYDNKLVDKNTKNEIGVNYLVFGIGAAIVRPA